jgi:DNA ligase (NAD+)
MAKQKQKDAITPFEAQLELETLAKDIAHHDVLYHQKDKPEISDAKYDALRRRFDALAEEFPAIAKKFKLDKKVGAPIATGFTKFRHAIPMTSLNNAFGEEDIADFTDRIRRFLGLEDNADITFMAEPKIDGVSANLRYEKGKLVVD